VFVTADRDFLGRRYENRDTKVAAGGAVFIGMLNGLTWTDLSFIRMIY
jgi:hypothetical protein